MQKIAAYDHGHVPWGIDDEHLAQSLRIIGLERVGKREEDIITL
jgi:hypothetical protein